MIKNMDETLKNSAYMLEQTRKANVFSTLVIILFGLAGHTLTIYLFSKKRYRNNSNNVYLLCLAIIDGSFLVLHFFEDSLRTFIDIYGATKLSLNQNHTMEVNHFVANFLKHINITDNFEFTCRFINYLRYVLRFISAYIIVAFTLQRAVLVYLPLSEKFKTKKSAWLTVFTITFISFLLNAWVLFFFEINLNDNNRYCDVKRAFKSSYFRITVVYISLIMLIPIITIFIGNSLIIFKTVKADLKRKKLQMLKKTNSKKSVNGSRSSKKTPQVSYKYRNKELTSRTFNSHLSAHREIEQISSNESSQRTINNYRLKIYYQSNNKVGTKMTNKLNSSNTVTKSLIFVSFSYAILNLPYFISWSIFFYEIAFNKIDPVGRNYLFTALQASEILYILNYSIYFYINYAFGSSFRNQFKAAVFTSKSNKSQATVQFYAEEIRQLVSEY